MGMSDFKAHAVHSLGILQTSRGIQPVRRYIQKEEEEEGEEGLKQCQPSLRDRKSYGG